MLSYAPASEDGGVGDFGYEDVTDDADDEDDDDVIEGDDCTVPKKDWGSEEEDKHEHGEDWI